MSKLTEKEIDLILRFSKYMDENKLSETCMVHLFELVGRKLNLKTISQYAKDNNMSYNGVKKHRKILEFFGCKFVSINLNSF